MPAIGASATRSGFTWIRDYDYALAAYLGASSRTIPTAKGDVSAYAVSIPEVLGPNEYNGAIPLDFGTPQDVLSPAFLPCIKIVPDGSIGRDDNRMHGWHKAYRVPTAAAVAAGVITDAKGNQGYSEYEEMVAPTPWNFRWTIYARAKQPGDIQKMARYLYLLMPEHFVLPVGDSEKGVRDYNAELKGIQTDIDLQRVLGREMSWAFDIEVNGEVEYGRAKTYPAAYRPTVTITTR